MISSRRLYAAPITVFVLGVLASIALLLWLVHMQHERIRHDFARLASDRSMAVAQRIQADFAIPEIVRQLFDASDFVGAEEFKTYVSSIVQETPELVTVVQAARVVDENGVVRHPIIYQEARSDEELLNGGSLDAIPGISRIIERAIEKGGPEWTQGTAEGINAKVVEKSGRLAPGWLVVLPLAPHPIGTTGKMSTGGVLLARIDLHRLMYESFHVLEKIGMDAVIYEGAIDESRVLSRWFSPTRKTAYDPVKEKDAARYAFTRTATIGGKDWVIYCRPAPLFLSTYKWWGPGLIFVGCLAISGLIAFYLLRQRITEGELQHQHEITRLLENVAVSANEAQDNRELLHESLSVMCRYLDHPFGHVYVPDSKNPDTLVSSHIFHIEDEERYQSMRHETTEMTFDIGSGMPGVVMLEARPVFIHDISQSKIFRRKTAIPCGLRSCFAFPVVVRGKVAAVVEFFTTEVSKPFLGWEELLTSMSRQISHAMERRLAAEDLLEKTAVLENAAEGIAHVDLAGNYLSVNKAYAKMCGVPGEELIGTSHREKVHPQEMDTFTAAYVTMLMDGRAEVKGRYVRSDGSIYHQELTMIRDLDRAGNLRGCHLFSRDVTEREEQQSALRDSEERFLAFMGNNPASASIKDEASRLVYVNPATMVQLGLTAENYLGKTPEDLVGVEAAQAVRASDRAVLETNRPMNLVEVIPDSEGRLRHWLVYKFPMKGSLGKRLLGVLCLDITERMEAEEAIIVARDEALESARMKSQFLANMSHEIRTPMNGLIGMLGLLRRTTLQPRQKELLHTAASAADSLLRLLNDILDFSKIEAGKLEIDPVVFDPRQCFRHAVKILAEPASKKGLELSYHVDDEVPEHLYGDSGRLAQIMVNLINNGIKFTDSGSVTATLSVDRRLSNSQIVLHGVVRDTGMGVAESHREIIFQPFRQSDSSTARQFGGTGLGLAICSQLAELMNGTIWVESEPSGGSAFHFTVQMEDTEAPLPILYDNQEIMPRAETSLRILLAEDNEINQQLVITVLEERGHSVVLATNGHEAVDLFKKATFDLILMDVQMPGKDGYEACSDIRQLPGGRHIPIYAVTAHALPEDRRRCIDAGMNDYLTKPIRIEEFARVVEAKVLRNETLPREPLARVQTRRTDSPHMPSQEKTRLIPPSVLPPKSFDLAALRVMVNNNDKLVLQLAASFARQASEDRANMRQALTDGNATLMERSAHRLKGSALSLSAAPLARVAQTLETSGRQNNLAIASGVWSEFEQVYDALTADLAALNC